MNDDQAKAAFRLQASYLKKQTDDIIDLVTSDAFLEKATAVLRTERTKQLEFAAKTMTPMALRESGVEIPDGLRISSRYFEENAPESTYLGSFPSDPDIPGPYLPPNFDPQVPSLPPRWKPPTIPGFPKLPKGHDPVNPGDPSDPDKVVVDRLPDDSAASVCICVGAGGCVGVGGGT